MVRVLVEQSDLIFAHNGFFDQVMVKVGMPFVICFCASISRVSMP